MRKFTKRILNKVNKETQGMEGSIFWAIRKVAEFCKQSVIAIRKHFEENPVGGRKDE